MRVTNVERFVKKEMEFNGVWKFYSRKVAAYVVDEGVEAHKCQ